MPYSARIGGPFGRPLSDPFMKLRIRSELTYRFEAPTDAIYLIQAARWPGQTILEERLEGPPGVERVPYTTADYGSRTLRARLSGDVRLM